MEGKLIGLKDSDGDDIGLWYTEDKTISEKLLAKCYLKYMDTDKYEEEDVDGFEVWAFANFRYNIERVFIEEAVVNT